MPSFLQFLKTKQGIASFLLLLVLLAGIPLGVYLTRQRQQLTSDAASCIEGSPKAIVELVLDDSTSMKCASGQSDSQCKVKQLQAAVRSIKPLIRTDDAIGIQGLEGILMPIKTMAANSNKYDNVVNNFTLIGGTPLKRALTIAETEVKRAIGIFPQNPHKVVLMVTDGCPNSDQDPRAQGQNLKSLGWTVAILGIQLGTDEDKCDEFGGLEGARQMMRETASDNLFFEVEDPVNIPESLKNIFTQSVCTEDPPPSPSLSPSTSPSPSPSPLPSQSFSPSPSPSASSGAGGSASPSPSPSPSLSPSPSPSPSASTSPRLVSYRLAETEAGLALASYKPYSQTPMSENFSLGDENPGAKQVWVEFKDNGTGEIRKEHINLKMVRLPKIVRAECTLDINRQDLKVTIFGSDFGDNPGKLKSGQTELDVLGWKNNQVAGILRKPGITGDDGKAFQFSLTRSDNVLLTEPIRCRVDTSMIALGARIFCRAPGKFDVPNVKIILTDQNNNRSEETVTISQDGTISGLKTKLQTGRPYAITIKAPNSLRTNALFTAGSGTTFVSTEDGSPFILPIGDISPVILQDGKINTLDRSEIIRQWTILGNAGGNRTGDFNKDSKVNSIDWACMRYDFNKEDESLPDLTVSPNPSPTSSTIVCPADAKICPDGSSVGRFGSNCEFAACPNQSPFPSVSSPSPSPLPFGQRAAYFLPIPQGSGSYQLNSQFSLDINIWSQNEDANLFSAQLKFNPENLEVVSIEKGTVLTNWVDSSFVNSTGDISIVAGLPSPGLKTTQGNDPLMARVFFRGKKAGAATINMTNESAIYSNSDNANIISGLISAPVVITQ